MHLHLETPTLQIAATLQYGTASPQFQYKATRMAQ